MVERVAGTWRRYAGDAIPPPAPGITYGPVQSRRLGRSLGINLSPPGCCVCSFACVYCEIERGPRESARWPSAGDVASSLSNALFTAGPLDSITLSGHGEPTLHPRFPAVVAGVLGESRRARPDVPVRILTNGSGVLRAEVARALDLLDERIVMLDAGGERISRPAPQFPLDDVIAGLQQLRDCTVQSCFVEGTFCNLDGPSIAAWMEQVRELQPRGVQIYTINRPPAASDARPASHACLEQIARALQRETGIEAAVFA